MELVTLRHASKPWRLRSKAFRALVISLCITFALLLAFTTTANAQDGSLAALRGAVSDPAGARISSAVIVITSAATGVEHRLMTDADGRYASPPLPPGNYIVRAEAPGMAAQIFDSVHLDVAGALELDIHLALAGTKETVNVSSASPMVETRSSEVSHVIDERAIEDLPVNGRRFTDFALLTPGVTQDPRGLTSSTNGDLAFGGIRGYQSQMLVDGADNNNSFFAQARGRYRAPYQFSKEVVQEFRVSSNAYSAEIGRSGGGVINVVTKSGTKQLRGSAFYYLRDKSMNARHAYSDVKPQDRQHQFGFTLGGRVPHTRVYFFGGWDQHIFRVPTAVRFLDGGTVLTSKSADYESADQALVESAAAKLSTQAGNFRSALLGNAGFLKFDLPLAARHFLTLRLSTSRYGGENNVFFDATSPVTNYAISENGTEQVSTESATASLTSAITSRVSNQLRVQFSRDLQHSRPNSDDVRTKIYDVLEAFGQSNILPRITREHKLHLSDSVSWETRRQSWKLGGDINQAWIYNYFPSMFGGQYIFDRTRVNVWTFTPTTYGMWITPLRAFAHNVPRYYSQNFGTAVSHPDTTEYAIFAQDAIRVTPHLALNLGVRYDRQTFPTRELESNPLWPASGKLPSDADNFAPRVGFAYTVGEERPLVIRGGYGLFYTRIPSIYTASVITDNGLAQSHLSLVNTQIGDAAIFPVYPNPLVPCAAATRCEVPANLAGRVRSEIAAFAPNFQTPFVQQTSLSMEREIANRLSVSVAYLYVHGQHLIRARDANLPAPDVVSYPVMSEDGSTFTGEYYDVASFSRWQTARSASCAFPPCIDDLARPIPQIGAIEEFDSAASSVYHGMTVSAVRRMTHGLYFRLGYTWAKAIDDGQDALAAGRPATVQNSYATRSERGLSSTDQRQRFVASFVAEPKPFHRDRPVLRFLFNDWKFSSIVTYGSGRPVNARVAGDANQDGNTSNDRLPGSRRNSYKGPNYATTDLRLSRQIRATERVRLELQAESFNLFNRVNRRTDISDDGFLASAASFVQQDVILNSKRYPAQFRQSGGFLKPNNAYAPRQVQVAFRLNF